MQQKRVYTAGESSLLEQRQREGMPLEWCLHVAGQNFGLPPADVREDAGATHALEPYDRAAHLAPAWYADDIWDPVGGLRFPALRLEEPGTNAARYLNNLIALEKNAQELWGGRGRIAIEPVSIFSGSAPDRAARGADWDGGSVAWWILYKFGTRMILVARPPR